MHELLSSLAPLKCPIHLVSEYYPLNANLEVLHINRPVSKWEEIQTMCVLLLVIPYPNIKQIKILGHQLYGSFKNYWDKMIQQKMCRGYAGIYK